MLSLFRCCGERGKMSFGGKRPEFPRNVARQRAAHSQQIFQGGFIFSACSSPKTVHNYGEYRILHVRGVLQYAADFAHVNYKEAIRGRRPLSDGEYTPHEKHQQLADLVVLDGDVGAPLRRN